MNGRIEQRINGLMVVMFGLVVVMPVGVGAAVYSLDGVSGVIEVAGRGGAGAVYFGWETFNDAGRRNEPINDGTPDIGSAVGVRFRTTNGEDHVLGSGNYYLASGNPAEEVTVVTAGEVGSGYTTLILQAVTAFDDFPGEWRFGELGGVKPQVVQGRNAVGIGQLWVRYDLVGNEGSYVIPFEATGPHFSLDRFVVDTRWSAEGFEPEMVVVPEPGVGFVAGVGLGWLWLRRRRG
jgi:hypothetical protein